MDWIERVNQAVGYIEKNLDGEISYEEISRIAASPIAQFQRFFVLTAGITLAKYIRRRKLTCALTDLQTTDEKVIDIAVKYGYESSDAFCFAFKRLYGITPSQARKSSQNLKHYYRIFFTLKITYIKGEKNMILLNVDKYRYYGPLFEGARIILNYMGEKYTPEYIQGISGAAFKIAGGCPSRPTYVCDFWPADFLKYLGYEVKEYSCYDESGNAVAISDKSNKMIEAVKKSIDEGKPALVWSAFSRSEWDVVCGYDDEANQLIGRCTLRGNDDYTREAWDMAKSDESFPAGAVIIGEKIRELDKKEAEKNSLISAVNHARKVSEDGNEGIQFYKKWGRIYSSEGADRGVADAYCYDVYSSVRRAGVGYLREISRNYGGGKLEYLQKAADCFENEVKLLESARPYISWDSPWGVDEARSKKLAPILIDAADWYEKGIDNIEKALTYFQ